MAPPGTAPVKKFALFNLTSDPIPHDWLQYIQEEANKDNEFGFTIEPVAAGPNYTRMDMARHCRQHFLSPESPFASRCFMAADDKSIATKTVIIVNLVLSFLEKENHTQGKSEDNEKDVIEGYMRVCPNSCIGFASIFESDVQGIDKYDGIARDAPDGILPRIDTPSPGD